MIEKIKEDLYVRRGLFNEWTIVYPIKKDISKPFTKNNINWKNLLIGGSWTRFLIIVLFILFLLYFSWAYHHDIAIAKDCITNPCKYCLSLPFDLNPELNLANLTKNEILRNPCTLPKNP